MKLESFQCADIPEARKILARSKFRELLLRNSREGGEQEFLEQATRHIRQELFTGYPYKRSFAGKQDAVLRRLLRQGHSPQEISRALAESWLHEREEFLLPSRSRLDRFGKTGALILLAVLLTWTTVILLFEYGRSHYLQATAAIVWLAPLVVLLSTVIGVVYYRLLRMLWNLCAKYIIPTGQDPLP